MIQQSYFTPKFAADTQVQTAARTPAALMREVMNYFRQGWQANLANAKVVGQSGSYIG
jgi:hypothetical protein